MTNFELTGVENKKLNSSENMLNVMLISIANSRKLLNKKELITFNREAKEGIYIQCKRVLHELDLTTAQYEIILQLISIALEI